MKKSLMQYLYIYILFFLNIFFFYKLDLLEKYSQYLVIGFVLLVIKDILLLFFEQKAIKKTVYDIRKIFNDISSKKITKKYFLLFLNRHYFFPIILTLYLIYLLISQTHLFGLDKSKIFSFINSDLLLGITIISGVFTIFKEELDNSYKELLKTTKGIGLNILFIILLSIIGTYIIYIQVMKLGFLSYPISIISGILIFLVGLSILEEEEEIQENI